MDHTILRAGNRSVLHGLNVAPPVEQVLKYLRIPLVAGGREYGEPT